MISKIQQTAVFLMIWSKIECTMHVPQAKRPTNLFKLVQQSRKHVLRAYCPYVYTLV